MTRLVTIRSINTIVDSNAKIELQQFLPDLLTHSADFLRKNQRSLRLNTLILLESLVKRLFNQNGLQGPGLIKVVKEIPALINETDIQLSQIAIIFITNIVNSYPDQIHTEALNNIFKEIISLVQSSLLQGSTLNASLNLLTALIRAPLPNKPSFEEIVLKLTEPVNSSSSQLLHRQSYNSIAKAVATVTQATSDNQKSSKLVTSLRNSLKDQHSSDSIRLYAILALGELGHCCSSLIDSGKNEKRTEQLIIESFGSPLEEIKSAASYALGNISTGNLKKFLPFLLTEISREERRQYLFLHALKEVIDEQTTSNNLKEADSTFPNGVSEIWDLLIQ
jgi:cullin-associated NEDD8-dissociated protein 1